MSIMFVPTARDITVRSSLALYGAMRSSPLATGLWRKLGDDGLRRAAYRGG
jgi:hypothetical protein